MAKVKVAHALVTYTEKIDDKTFNHEVAFRGQVVDIPDPKELERLRSFGAVVSPDTELDRPGLLLPLPVSASDEEITNWVANASDAEIKKLAAERPMLRDRIAGSLVRIEDARRRQEALLGIKRRVQDVLEQVDEEQDEFDEFGRPNRSDPGESAGVQQGVGGEANVPHDYERVTEGTEEDDDTGGTTAPSSGDWTDSDADAVVRGNVKDVTTFISENPHLASSILEAENRHAATGANNGRVRDGVVRAVEAAAGHTQ